MAPDIASMIASKMKAPKGSEMEKSEDPVMENEEETDSSDSDIAASEVFEAIKSDDVDAFKGALKSFVKLCGYEKSDE